MLKNALLRCLKSLGFFIAILIVLFAVLITAARAVTPLLNDKRVFFEKWASHVLHQPVHIGRVTMGWGGFDPELRFNNVVVRNPQHAQSLLKIDRLAISINLFQSVLNWKLLPGHLFISGTQLDIYQNQHGQLNVKGMVDLHGKQKHVNLGYLKDIVVSMLTQSEISLQHINVNFHTADGRLVPIKNLRLKVANGMLHHQMAGVALLAQKVPTTFRFVINLKSADITKAHFSADVYFKANNLLIKQWVDNRYLRHYFKALNLTHGVANVEAWLKWRDAKLSALQSEIKTKNIGLHLAAKHKNIVIHRFNANVYWQRRQDGWALSADHINLRMRGKTWPEHSFGMRVFQAGKAGRERMLFTSQFVRLRDIRDLAAAVGYWPQSAQKIVAKLKPHGDLYNPGLVVAWSAGKPIFYRVRAEFNNLGFLPWGKLPGATALTGFIDATPAGGKLKLQSRRTTLKISTLFSQPLFFEQLNLDTHWTHSGGGWQISVPSVMFKNDMGSVHSAFTLAVPKSGSPVIKMMTNFNVNHVKLLKNYIPTYILKAKLRHWLSRAFLAGKIPQGTMKLVGPLDDFPFDNKRGHFYLTANMKNLTVKYLPNWPAIQQLDGLLTFDGRSMSVAATHGVTVGNPLDHIQAAIPNLQQPILTVMGHSQSNLTTGVAFLQKTPLKVAKQLRHTALHGPMGLNIKLLIPLYEKKQKKHDVIASGDVTVDHGTMQLKAWHTQFTEIKGRYHFVNNDISAKHVTALHYGLPVIFDVTTLNAETSAPVLQIEAGGQLNIASLEEQLKLPALKYLRGTTSYRALVKIRDGSAAAGSSVSLASDLSGIAITLPPPYGKPANDTQPFFMTLKTVPDKPLALTLQYGKHFSAAASFKQSNKNLKFISGELLMGEGQAQLQQSTGLVIAGKMQKVVWSQWQKYLGAYLQNPGIASKKTWLHSARIRKIKLQIGKLLAFKHTLNSLYVELVPNDKGWSVTIKNPIAVGNLYIPDNRKQRWYGHFSRLYLPKLNTKAKGNQQKINPREIPPLDLTSDDFRYGDKALGQVHIRLTPLPTGLTINKLTVKNNLFGIAVAGAWRDEQGHQQSNLSGQFGSRDLGRFLKNWGITSAVEGGSGAANFALTWPGSPRDFSAAKLSGNMNVDFRNGRISQVIHGAKPELGLGRLLNLFSLQTLPLLPLKLAHLTKKGFAFNLLKGDFNLNHGNVKTHNASIVGSVAWVRVSGIIGFARKNYDLQLNIVPNITSSLPLIIGIAGGPLAGAIAWVANKILAPQLGKAAQINYRVTGSWNKPSIVKIPAPAATNTART